MDTAKETLGGVLLVKLQFSFSKFKVVPLIPLTFGSLKKESRSEYAERKARAQKSGTAAFIDKIDGVSLLEFLGNLRDSGYELVSALYQERLNGDRTTYPCVRYVFCRRERAVAEERFAKVKELALAELEKMCRETMWRVRAFVMPYFKDGKEIAHEKVMSVNLEHRQPLLGPDGKPLLVWKRGERREKVGNEPPPLQPKLRLGIIDGGIIEVVPTEATAMAVKIE